MLKNEINKPEDDLNAAKMLLSLAALSQENKQFVEKENERVVYNKILKPHPKFRVKVSIQYFR
jgi:hypothetical protein